MTELLTPRECADYRRCSLRKLDRERANGLGPPFVSDGGRVFYRRGDVDDYLASHLTGGEDREQRAAAVEGRKPTPLRGLRGRRKPSDFGQPRTGLARSKMLTHNNTLSGASLGGQKNAQRGANRLGIRKNRYATHNAAILRLQ